jgi:hypothetical protein
VPWKLLLLKLQEKHLYFVLVLKFAGVLLLHLPQSLRVILSGSLCFLLACSCTQPLWPTEGHSSLQLSWSPLHHLRDSQLRYVVGQAEERLRPSASLEWLVDLRNFHVGFHYLSPAWLQQAAYSAYFAH